MAEHSAVNRRVVGSSPTCGAISGEGRWNLFPAAFSFWEFVPQRFHSLFLSPPFVGQDVIGDGVPRIVNAQQKGGPVLQRQLRIGLAAHGTEPRMPRRLEFHTPQVEAERETTNPRIQV